MKLRIVLILLAVLLIACATRNQVARCDYRRAVVRDGDDSVVWLVPDCKAK